MDGFENVEAAGRAVASLTLALESAKKAMLAATPRRSCPRDSGTSSKAMVPATPRRSCPRESGISSKAALATTPRRSCRRASGMLTNQKPQCMPWMSPQSRCTKSGVTPRALFAVSQCCDVDFATPSQKCRTASSGGDALAPQMRPDARGRSANAKVLTSQNGRWRPIIGKLGKRIAQARAKSSSRAVRKTPLQGGAAKAAKPTQAPRAARSKASGRMSVRGKGSGTARPKPKAKPCVATPKAARTSEPRRRASASQVGAGEPRRRPSASQVCASASKAAGLSEPRRRASTSQVKDAATPLRKRASLART